jgi:hypothetical protein
MEKGFTRENIYTILQDVETAKDNKKESSLEEQCAKEIIDIYTEVLEKPPGNRITSEGFLKRHHSFVESLEPLISEGLEKDTEIILRSQAVALHFLLVSGGIDKVWENHMKSKFGEHEVSLKGEELLDEKVTAVLQYLHQLELKNQESDFFHSSLIAPMGTEWEYIDPALYKAYKLRDVKHPKAETVSDEQVSILLSSKTIPGLLAEVGHFENIFSPHEHKYQIGEIVSNPTSSYRTQLRNILYLRNTGLVGAISSHETFSGIKLTPEHTEVMDARAIVTAAGLIGDTEDQEWATTVLENENYYGSYHVKPSITDEGDYVVYPKFRYRLGKPIQPLREGDPSFAVEWRESGPVENNFVSFSKYVRRVRYEFNVSCAIKAFQKPSETRTLQEQSLADIFSSHLDQWDEILQQAGLSNVSSEGRYFSMSNINSYEEAVEKARTNDYNVMLNKIEATMILNSTFKESARKIVRELNHDVREVLNTI